MKRALLVFAFAFWAHPGPALAQDASVSDADQGAIRAVIEDQLAAFQRDDAIAAFAYASPDIQSRFATPEAFMRMVRTGYRPVYRPREVQFRDILTFEETPIQRVFVVGPNGEPVVALYVMQRQIDGTWKIDGCYLVRANDQAV